MRRLCVVVGMLVLASLLPKAASAGPITVVDPSSASGEACSAPRNHRFNGVGNSLPFPVTVGGPVTPGFSCLPFRVTKCLATT